MFPVYLETLSSKYAIGIYFFILSILFFFLIFFSEEGLRLLSKGHWVFNPNGKLLVAEKLFGDN